MKKINLLLISLALCIIILSTTLYACQKEKLTDEQISWKNDFEIVLSKVDKLEDLALEYAETNGKDVRKLLSGYLRIGRYDSAVWNGLAGVPDKGFTAFVAQSTSSDYVASLRDIDLVATPYTGAENDFIHTFGTYSMIVTGYGDLGGWAGDTATLAEDLLTETGSVEELTASGKAKYFNIVGGFDAPDVVSDLDAVVFYNEWIPGENKLADVMRRYYNETIKNEKDRIQLYAKYDGIDLTLSQQALRDYIYNRVMTAKGVTIFWANDKFDIKVNEDRIIAACNCYADYLYFGVK